MAEKIKCPKCGSDKSKKLKEEAMGSGTPMQTRKCLNEECNEEFRGFYT